MVSDKMIAMMLSISIVCNHVLCFSHLLFYLVYRFAYTIPSRHVIFVPTPVNKPRFSYNKLIWHCPPKAAIVAMIAIVSHHEIVPFWHFDWREVENLLWISAVIHYFGIVMNAWMILHIRIFHPQNSFDIDNLVFWIVLFDIFVAFMRMDVEIFVVYEKIITSHRYTALDIVDFGIDGIAKDDNIASFWTFALDKVPIAI